MKIVGPPSSNVAELGRRTAGGAGRAEPAAGGGAAAGEKVAISDAARWMADWKAAIGDPLAIDETRVAELRREVIAGSYDPAPEEIAEALLRELATLRHG